MKIPDTAPVPEQVPSVDLNDLLLDHPAACFIFMIGDDLVIADRAAVPDEQSTVIVKTQAGFATEHYYGQKVFAVLTYMIRRLA